MVHKAFRGAARSDPEPGPTTTTTTTNVNVVDDSEHARSGTQIGMPDFPAQPLSDHAGEVLDRATNTKYRFQVGETAAAGFRRVALAQIDSATATLQSATADDPGSAIHETRKDLKKLRSLLRLVRGPIGPESYARENDRYRRAARALSGARDAEVLPETLAALRERYGAEMPATDALEARLALELESATVAESDVEPAREEIAAGAGPIAALALDDHAGFDLFAAGLERAYRRGRRGLREVQEHPDPEAVHDWRKRVKDLWYDLRLLRNAWPAALDGPEQAAHELADLLGDHHDLTVLAEALSDTSEERAIEPAIEARQAELLAAGLELGRRLYAEQPKAFVARVEGYWRVWQLAAS